MPAAPLATGQSVTAPREATPAPILKPIPTPAPIIAATPPRSQDLQTETEVVTEKKPIQPSTLTRDQKIQTLPIYKRFKKNFIHSPGKIWILTQLISHSPITSKAMYNKYLKDEEAQKMGLFRSKFTRQKGTKREISAPHDPFQGRFLHSLPPENGAVRRVHLPPKSAPESDLISSISGN